MSKTAIPNWQLQRKAKASTLAIPLFRQISKDYSKAVKTSVVLLASSFKRILSYFHYNFMHKHNVKSILQQSSLTAICGMCRAYVVASRHEYTQKKKEASIFALLEFRSFYLLYFLNQKRSAESLSASVLLANSEVQQEQSAPSRFLTSPWSFRLSLV